MDDRTAAAAPQLPAAGRSTWDARPISSSTRRCTAAGGSEVGLVEIGCPEPIGSLLLAHHKPTWQSRAERERELQAVASARMIEETVGDVPRHGILAGDFYATPDAASIRFWTGRQSLDGMSVHYQDAWEAAHGDAPGHTFTPANPIRSGRWHPRPGRRIDYVMVRCGDPWLDSRHRRLRAGF